MKKLLLAVLVLLMPVVVMAQSKIVATFYATWHNTTGSTIIEDISGNGTMSRMFPIDSADISGLDVLVYFYDVNVSTSSPYYTVISGGADSSDYFKGNNGDWASHPYAMDSLIAKCHRNGTMVLAELMAVNATALVSTWDDSSDSHRLANAVARYAKRHNFDGVDFNFEYWGLGWSESTRNTNKPYANRFVRLLRQALNAEFTTTRAILTCSPAPDDFSFYYSSIDTAVTYWFTQMYAYSGAWNPCASPDANTAWMHAAVAEGDLFGCSERDIEVMDLNELVANWAGEGHDVSKLVPGLLPAHTFKGVASFNRAYDDDRAETSTRYRRLYQENKSLTNTYDAVRGMHYLHGKLSSSTPNDSWGWPGQSSGDSSLIVYVSDSTCRKWAYFVDSMDIGGMFVYDFGYDFDDGLAKGSGRSRIHEQFYYYRDLYEGGSPPTPTSQKYIKLRR